MTPLEKIIMPSIIFLASIMLIFLFLLVIQGLVTNEEDYITIEIECFDKHHNRILELTCEKEIYCGNNWFYISSDCEVKK